MKKREDDNVMAAKEPVKCEREHPITNQTGFHNELNSDYYLNSSPKIDYLCTSARIQKQKRQLIRAKTKSLIYRRWSTTLKISTFSPNAGVI